MTTNNGNAVSSKERAVGALMGAFIGDALGLGPHWYYDLEALRRDFGEWITDYTSPRPGRYHEGMKAGQLSQSGVILRLLMETINEAGGYDEARFCRTLDDKLFPTLDGTAEGGPGGFTSQSIRETWALRVRQELPWGQVAGYADNTEAAERAIALAARYSTDMELLADSVSKNTRLTQVDETVNAMTVAFGAVLGLLIQGHPMDESISEKLMQMVSDRILPFHAVTLPGSRPSGAGTFASPDALLTPSWVARAASENLISPPWKVSIVYGMPCAIYHQLPASYYLAARFPDDFEQAVLHAINGGGQNMARAMLTGALVGAQVGIKGIPRRFIEGLEKGEQLLAEIEVLAAQLPVNN